MTQIDSSDVQPEPRANQEAHIHVTERHTVVAAVDRLLKMVQPLRGTSLEINQLIQELTFLHASLSLDLRLPDDWHAWLMRALRSSVIEKSPDLRKTAGELMHVLNAQIAGKRNESHLSAIEKERPMSYGSGPVNSPVDVNYKLRLFIAGSTRPSQRAMENLCIITSMLNNSRHEIIDILEQPELAEQERIIATPTLLRDFPLPKRKIIGDLSDTRTVLLLIGA